MLHGSVYVNNNYLIIYFKAVKHSSVSRPQELSQFSDAPGDALLEDIIQPIDRVPGDQVVGASTSTSTHGYVSYGKSDLAKELRVRMAQKYMENQIEHQKSGKLLEYVKDVIDIDVPVCLFVSCCIWLNQ